MEPVTLITGCSSGIGLETAVLLASRGHRVYATMRDLSRGAALRERAAAAGVELELLPLDVTAPATIAAAAAVVEEREGRLTNLVNNAGFSYFGILEHFSEDEIRDQFDTNVYGPLRVTRAFLPLLRRDPSSRRTLVNVTSLNARVVYPLMGLYAATKFALLGLTEEWRHELRPFGIRAVSVEPGPIETKFGGGSLKRPAGYDPADSPYRTIVEAAEESFARLTTRDAGPPSKVARTILRAVEARNPRLHWTCGPLTTVSTLSLRFAPYGFVEWALRRNAGLHKLGPIPNGSDVGEG